MSAGFTLAKGVGYSLGIPVGIIVALFYGIYLVVKQVALAAAFVLHRGAVVAFGTKLPEETFLYRSPLDHGEIRLVKIQPPPAWPWSLFCTPELTMQTVDLEDAGNSTEYLALSYTWGPPQYGVKGYGQHNLKTVILEGAKFSVTRNLYDAILELRFMTELRNQHFWIDAISIAQADSDERRRQVLFMDKIYFKARCVLIWLGPADTNTNAGFKLIRRLHKALDGSDVLNRLSSIGGRRGSRLHLENEMNAIAGSVAKTLPHFESPAWKNAINILRRTWFTRAWIVQELVLGLNPVVLCGRNLIAWEDIASIGPILTSFQTRTTSFNSSEMFQLDNESMNLLELCRSKQGARVMASSLLRGHGAWISQAVWKLELLRSVITLEDQEQADQLVACGRSFVSCWGSSGFTSPHVALLFLIAFIPYASASDPRDKVYAFLGIINHFAKLEGDIPCAIEPDYRPQNTATEVFKSLIALTINDTGSATHIDMLIDSNFKNSYHASSPSWVPDFANNLQCMSTETFAGVSMIHPPFRASSFRGKECVQRQSCNVNSNRLSVSALQIGSINTVFAEFHIFILQDNPWALHNFVTANMTQIYSFTGQARMEAFWRTVVLDLDHLQRPASSEVKEGFKRYVAQGMLEFLVNKRCDGASQSELLKDIEDFTVLAKADQSNSLPDGDELRIELEACSLLVSDEEWDNVRINVDRMVEYIKKLEPSQGAFVNGIGQGALRCPCISAEGHLVFGPQSIELNDTIWVIDGCNWPTILRPCLMEADTFSIVGSAYVHGVMDGEAVGCRPKWYRISLV